MSTHKVQMYAADDPAVWPLIGPVLTSRAAARELGGQPFADGAVAWFIATLRGKVVGIACLKHLKGDYWEDCDYVPPEHRGKGVHLSLCAARTRHLATLPAAPLRVCVTRARWKKHYLSRGFAEVRAAGNWVYGVKNPPEPKPEEAK